MDRNPGGTVPTTVRRCSEQNSCPSSCVGGSCGRSLCHYYCFDEQ